MSFASGEYPLAPGVNTLFTYLQIGELMANRERKNVVYLRLSDKELWILKKKVELSEHRNISDYLRQFIVEGIVYNVDYRYLRKYNYQLGKIGNNINQSAKRINETRSIYQSDMDELQKEMDQVWQLQKSMLSDLRYRNQ
jgi:hypothetical protein